MDILFQVLVALYAFGLGRVPWRYYIPLTIPLLVLAYMAALYSGANWLLVYAAFIVYLFPLAFVIFFLDGIVGAVVRRVVGPDVKLPPLVRDGLLFAVAFGVILFITHLVFGLPRVVAYFLGGLVAKEPLRTLDLGYYFGSWLDILRAVPALTAYVFFFLFARGALYRLGHEVKVPAGATYDPDAPPPPTPRTKPGQFVLIVVCVYILPTAVSLAFMLYTGGFGNAEYNALGLDDDGRRVLWADVNGDGRADAVLAGGTYANPDAFAVALDGRTGDTLWYTDLPGEWCSASPQAGADVGFFLTKRPRAGTGEIFALDLATGVLRWRRDLPADAAVLNRGTPWQRRGGTLIVPIDYERAWAVDARDGRVVNENAPLPKAEWTPEPYLEYAADGVYYYRDGDVRRFTLRVDDFFRQFSPYYSFRLSDYRPGGFDLLWTGDGFLLLNMPDKYYYGLVIPAWVDALYRLDEDGGVRWELADGRLHTVEAVAGVSDDLILIVGRGSNRRPLLAAVSPRTGAVLWTWNRPLSARERISRQWKYFTEMYSS
jgi:outer membrane protein assembly factor BamB